MTNAFRYRIFLLTGIFLGSCSSLAFSMDVNDDFSGEGNVALVAPNYCQPYCYVDGPYFGASAGFRVNFTSLPAVYVGTEGTGSLGWSKIFYNGNYIAIEAFGGDSAKIRDDWSIARKYGVRTSWSGGLNILPGHMITPLVLGYLRLGAVETHFLDRHRNSIEGQVGLGAETNLIENIDVRSEYVYTNYKPVKDIRKPNTSLYNVGFVYKFNG